MDSCSLGLAKYIRNIFFFSIYQRFGGTVKWPDKRLDDTGRKYVSCVVGGGGKDGWDADSRETGRNRDEPEWVV